MNTIVDKQPIDIQLFAGIQTFSVDDLFKDDDATSLAEGSTTETDPVPTDPDNTQLTEAMTKRINKVKQNTTRETEDRIAKSLGYADYAEMTKSQDRKLIEEAGYDPEDSEEVINKLVEKRLSQDPRLKRLEEIEERERTSFVKVQLDEISKLTGQNLKSLDQVDKDTLALWEKTGNLKQAYLAVHGETLLQKSTSTSKFNETSHLASKPSGIPTKIRALSPDERNIYRQIIPGITEDELNKLTLET